MTRRELRVVDTERVVGVVEFDEQRGLRLEGSAVQVFAVARRTLGDAGLGRDLMAHGWSNGYLYLAPEGPAPSPGGARLERGKER